MANKVVPVPLPVVNAIVRFLGKCPYDDVADFIVVLGQLPTLDAQPQPNRQLAAVPPAPKNRVEAANETPPKEN